jgi:hypothetical protein
MQTWTSISQAELMWFHLFRQRFEPKINLDPLRPFFCDRPAPTEELQATPIPTQNQEVHRPIVASFHPPAEPTVYRNRAIAIGELVILRQHNADKGQWPDDNFYVAEVLEIKEKTTLKVTQQFMMVINLLRRCYGLAELETNSNVRCHP